jgi:hypothetical protein
MAPFALKRKTKGKQTKGKERSMEQEGCMHALFDCVAAREGEEGRKGVISISFFFYESKRSFQLHDRRSERKG